MWIYMTVTNSQLQDAIHAMFIFSLAWLVWDEYLWSRLLPTRLDNIKKLRSPNSKLLPPKYVWLFSEMSYALSRRFIVTTTKFYNEYWWLEWV